MVRSILTPRGRTLVSCLALGLLASGCRDAPTMPSALQQIAGGQEWVAMPAPADLPGLATWLPYVERTTPAGRAAFARVQELSREAVRARAQGQLALASELSAEAERTAVLSLARFPAPVELQRGLYALEFWSDRVEAEVALERAPELGAALEEVRTARAHAAAMLAAGDTTSAVLHMARAAERIRGFTPTAVALRVLTRVEARLRAEPERGRGTERALHLLASARQELLTGDPRRALRRALYALQLAHGDQMPSPAGDDCLGPGCDG